MVAIVVVVMLLLAMTGRSVTFHAAGTAVGQCHAPLHTRPVTAPASEPVWRTFTEDRDGFSLSLPATWDGLRVGDPLPTRSPWLGDSLQRVLGSAGRFAKFVAVGRPGAPDLFVDTIPAVPVDSVDCRLTVSSEQPGSVGRRSNVRAGRIHLLAGDANETTFNYTESVGGRQVDYANFRFALLRGSPRSWLVLNFAAPQSEAGQAEPVFWQIAESLRLQPRPTQPGVDACLVRVPTRPDVLSPAGRTCPVPVGQPYFRFDCAAWVFSPSVDVSAYEYDLASAAFTGAAHLTPVDGACRGTAPPGKGLAIDLPGAGLADAVVAIDFVATSTARAFVGLAARRSGGDEVYTTCETTTGSMGLWLRKSGKDQSLGSAVAGWTSSPVRRLVLWVSGSQETASVDDQTISETSTGAVTQAGGVEAYLSNPDSSTPVTFDILRFVVYQTPAAG